LLHLTSFCKKREEHRWFLECHEIPHKLKNKEIEVRGTKAKRYQLLCTVANRSRNKEHHGLDLRRQSRRKVATHLVIAATLAATTVGMLPSNNDTYKFIIAVRLFENRQSPYITLTYIMLLMLIRILYTLSERSKKGSDQTRVATLSRAHCHLGVDSACLTLSKWRR